jgi:hypothetical protein
MVLPPVGGKTCRRLADSLAAGCQTNLPPVSGQT